MKAIATSHINTGKGIIEEGTIFECSKDRFEKLQGIGKAEKAPAKEKKEVKPMSKNDKDATTQR